MNEKSKALVLGIFIVAALALVAWLVLFLRPTPGDGERLLHVRFTNVDRILVRTRVVYGGKPIGIVEEINELPNPRDGPSDASGNLYIYEVVLKVDSSVHIYSYDEIALATSGLFGEKSIAIVPKAPPPGAPPACEVTTEILYAKSEDKFEEAIGQINSLCSTFHVTLTSFHRFLNDNSQEMHDNLCEMHKLLERANDTDIVGKTAHSLATLDLTMAKADIFLAQAIDSSIIEKANNCFCCLEATLERIERGEGTLGRLLSSDSTYFQLHAVLTKFETVLSDINNYGLLFQYDKCWQKNRVRRMNQMRCLQSPMDFYRYFDHEMVSIQTSLARTNELVDRMQMCQIPIGDECFCGNFLELLSKVEHLHESLKVYTEMLMGAYCQKCR